MFLGRRKKESNARLYDPKRCSRSNFYLPFSQDHKYFPCKTVRSILRLNTYIESFILKLILNNIISV